MLCEPYPIELFVSAEFHSTDIAGIIIGMNLEPDEVKFLVVKRFIDMGVFEVFPGLEDRLHNQITFFLHHDPMILKKVEEALERFQKRQEKKHA